MKMTNHPNDGRRVGDACPSCDGKLALRKNGRTHGYFLGCDQFPTCAWACLPHSADVRVRRESERARRRAWAMSQDERREARWELEDERGRESFLRYDEWRASDDEPEAEQIIGIWF